MMMFRYYQVKAQRTYKPNRAENHALGIAGEAGEVCELLKKHIYHLSISSDELRDRLHDELGDLLWYVAALATDYGLSLDAIARDNLEKLKQRYPDGFVTGGGIRPTDTKAPLVTHEELERVSRENFAKMRKNLYSDGSLDNIREVQSE